MFKPRFIIVQLLILFLPFNIWSQTRIYGKVFSKQNKALESAIVSINEPGKEKIIAYEITDSEGNFQLVFSSSSKFIILKVRMMGYRMITDTLQNKSQTKEYFLSEKDFKLKEVVVKIPPVTQRGDTISYKVSAFAKQNDRTIADVLDKMPGIEVLPNGQILYQGKPINKYYINGLDLLGGKYKLANDNLPYEEVSRVEVLENHQPVKILDSLIYSDQAAINIKLKKKYTFTGQAWCGAGFSPLLREINFTPMLFAKNRQVLFSGQSNNTGDDYRNQLNVLTSQDLMLQVEEERERESQLGIISPASPGFSKKRWFDNDSQLLSFHFLQKMRKDKELKLNASYLYNDIKEAANIFTRFYTSEEVWSLQEILSNRFYNNTFQSELGIKKNTKKQYFINVLKFRNDWNESKGNIISDEKVINQNESYNMLSVSNHYKTIFSFGKQLVTFGSDIRYLHKPENLIVTPGVFKEILNEGNEYEQVYQYLKLNTFYSDNYIDFTKAIGSFVLSPKIGFKIKSNNFKSYLTIDNGNVESQLSNHTNENQEDGYGHFTLQYKTHNWRARLYGKADYSRYFRSNLIDNAEQKRYKPFFSSGLGITYYITSFWKSITSFSQAKQWDDFSQSNNAYILENYRNLFKTNIPLSTISRQNFSQVFSYRNPLLLLFLRTSYMYRVSSNQYLYQTEISPEGAMELQAVKYPHKKKNHYLTGDISKYFPAIKTTFHLQINFSEQKYPQVINEIPEEITNYIMQYFTKINWDINQKFDFFYKASFTDYKTEVSGNELSGINTSSHLMQLSFSTHKKHSFIFDLEYRNDKGSSIKRSALFSDFTYRFSFPKKKWDFEIQWRNITNRKLYTNMVYDAFSYKETVIDLRPSQILFKVRFSL